MIAETALAHAFVSSHSSNSTIQGPPVNDWSKVNKYPLSQISFYQRYFDIIKDMFYNQHYPVSMLQAYANVYMFGQLNTGVNMLIKQDGKFKKISYEIVQHLNGIKDLKITTCL